MCRARRHKQLVQKVFLSFKVISFSLLCALKFLRRVYKKNHKLEKTSITAIKIYICTVKFSSNE